MAPISAARRSRILRRTVTVRLGHLGKTSNSTSTSQVLGPQWCDTLNKEAS